MQFLRPPAFVFNEYDKHVACPAQVLIVHLPLHHALGLGRCNDIRLGPVKVSGFHCGAAPVQVM